MLSIQKHLLFLKIQIFDCNLKMKKSFSIALLLVFFYGIIGFYLNFQIEQCRIKEEIKEKIINNLPENKLTILKISTCENDKIEWIEQGKEFRYKGEMFDLVKIKQEKGTTIYYCFCDSKESKLLLSLDKLVKDQCDHSQSRSVQKKQVINYYFQEGLFSQPLTASPVHYFPYTSAYNYICPEVITPPPRKAQA
jgi:hypothetical protein